jgi:hypothetical protein
VSLVLKENGDEDPAAAACGAAGLLALNENSGADVAVIGDIAAPLKEKVVVPADGDTFTDDGVDLPILKVGEAEPEVGGAAKLKLVVVTGAEVALPSCSIAGRNECTPSHVKEPSPRMCLQYSGTTLDLEQLRNFQSPQIGTTSVPVCSSACNNFLFHRGRG